MRSLAAGASLLLLAGPARAQQAGAPAQTPPPAPVAAETRPAVTTPFGDTGLWFVPTAEVLTKGGFAVSGYRVNFDREEGFTDISHFVGAFGYGLSDNVELFLAWRADTRVRRAISPLFSSTLGVAGSVERDVPVMPTRWSGDRVGDSMIGIKINLASEQRQQPAAFAIRAILQAGSGRTPYAGSGKMSGYIDAIVSKEANKQVEFAGYGGVMIRQDRSDMTLPESFRWGFGAGFPSRAPLRAYAEVTGEALFKDTVTVTNPVRPADGSVSPAEDPQKSPVDLNFGVTYHHPKGFFAGAGLSLGANLKGRSTFSSAYQDSFADKTGFQVRLGYSPGGVRVYVPPPPPPPPAPAPPPPNQAPTVRAQCEPCTVNVGERSSVTADAQDPDGDPLTYKWSAPTGTFGDAAARQSPWTAPMQEGAVPVTVTVSDGKGGTASDTVTIQVVRPPKKEIVFEDVHFDFDRYSLRSEATRLLDEAVQQMRDNPEVRIEIEGHTCNIGTAEYNLALGERRATAVRDYLVSQGISADRLRTISYGEERPKYDNAREETRRLNRRAALVVRIQ